MRRSLIGLSKAEHIEEELPITTKRGKVLEMGEVWTILTTASEIKIPKPSKMNYFFDETIDRELLGEWKTTILGEGVIYTTAFLPAGGMYMTKQYSDGSKVILWGEFLCLQDNSVRILLDDGGMVDLNYSIVGNDINFIKI